MTATQARRSLIPFLVAALAALAGLVLTAPPAQAATSQFRGMNWAVLGDNFSTGPPLSCRA
ncbi:hypothetical protein [Nonomuraea salmonea]|uniref:hypothetical protein n=1 Tax=Nonomuraea salmonea TaxID=46181 RepID=UPI002FE8A39A